MENTFPHLCLLTIQTGFPQTTILHISYFRHRFSHYLSFCSFVNAQSAEGGEGRWCPDSITKDACLATSVQSEVLSFFRSHHPGRPVLQQEALQSTGELPAEQISQRALQQRASTKTQRSVTPGV